MGNCLPSHAKRDVSLVFVGLDGAGKTTAVNGLAGLPIDAISPTCGLNTLTFKKGSYNINVLDLGGGAKIRDIWKNYFPEAHGLVFAIDSSDPDRLSETKEVLEKLLDNERIKQKPVLILANKQDNNNALKEDEVRNELSLTELEQSSQCPCKVMLSAAIRSKPKRRNADKGLIQGLNWLLNEIEHEYDQLNTRVTCDVENRRLELEAQMRERMERVKKRRAERERREEAEAAGGGDAVVGEEVEDEMKPSSRETSFQEEPEIPSLKDAGNDEAGLLKSVSVTSSPTLYGDMSNGMEKKKKRKKKKNRVKPIDDHVGMSPSIKPPTNLPPLNPHTINHAYTHNEHLLPTSLNSKGFGENNADDNQETAINN